VHTAAIASPLSPASDGYRARRPPRHLHLAGEAAATFNAVPDPGEDPVAAVAALRTAVVGLRELDIEGCDDGQLDTLIAGVQGQLDRLTSLRDRYIGARQRRSIRAAGPGREQQAVRATNQRLADDLRLSPGETKRSGEAGRRLAARPELAGDIDAGRLRPDQAKVIADVLDQAPLEAHDALRDELLDAAARQDPVALGRTARRRLAELDQQAAVTAHRRRHQRRSLRLSPTPDGMVAINGVVSGLAAETITTAIDAFRTPDRPGDPARAPEQRTADAFEAVCRAALDLGTAPTNRRVQPHVTVTVDLDRLARRTGAGHAAWTGPIPTTDLERFAASATIRVLGLDIHGLPIAMSRATGDPTAALYLALAHRDGGCRYPGCDAPATWCDIAHATARRDRGQLHLDNALLLCRRHHRKLDLGNWTITIEGTGATFTHPNGRTLDASPARGPD
jgi:hypothetical protein